MQFLIWLKIICSNLKNSQDANIIRFTYYGPKDAENIIVAMGSITETTKEVIDYLNAKGEKVGLISVHLYRPFSAKYFFNVLPKSVKRICCS